MKRSSKLISGLFGLNTSKPVKRDRKLGMAPGTVTYLGRREGASSVIQVLRYDETDLKKSEVTDIDSLAALPDGSATEWINVIGLSDELLMSRIGKICGLNSLVVEDIVNTNQRPKIDEYEDHLFIVLKMLHLNEEEKIIKEHVALVLKQGRVYVYQEIVTDVFDGVKERIEDHSGRIRTRGADYLLFALLDAIIDNYFLVLDAVELKIDELEMEVHSNPNSETALKIQRLRKEVITLRGWIAPSRELISRLINSESPLISKHTRIFLHDVHDHVTEINETLQIQREMAFSLMDMYMSNVSNKMNEVMKVLTIMASIFIPLTFLAGIYGMNFKYMPELEWEYAYFVLLGIMLLVFITMIFYFKKKRWI